MCREQTQDTCILGQRKLMATFTALAEIVMSVWQVTERCAYMLTALLDTCSKPTAVKQGGHTSLQTGPSWVCLLLTAHKPRSNISFLILKLPKKGQKLFWMSGLWRLSTESMPSLPVQPTSLSGLRKSGPTALSSRARHKRLTCA